MRHYGETKAQRQAQWMGEFADKLVTLYPQISGRIEWDTAKYYYLYGKTVDDAVSEYSLARNMEPSK
jgi:hypothetical protein